MAASATAGKALAGTGQHAEHSGKSRDENPYNPRTYEAMPTRAFGKTGFKVGILSLGGQATLEQTGTEEASEKIINRALDLGVNYIDTAAGYGRGQQCCLLLGAADNPMDISHRKAETVVVKGIGQAESLGGKFTVRSDANALAE